MDEEREKLFAELRERKAENELRDYVTRELIKNTPKESIKSELIKNRGVNSYDAEHLVNDVNYCIRSEHVSAGNRELIVGLIALVIGVMGT